MTIEGRKTPMQSSGIFYDGAGLDGLRLWKRTGVIDGATTNPLLMQKANVLDIPRHIEEMAKIGGKDFPISVEIPDTRMTVGQTLDLARRYQERFPENIVIKVPMDPREPTKALEVMFNLAQEGIRVNATLGLTGGQLICAAEALRKSTAKGDNYISLFWGRRDQAQEQIIKAALEKLPENERAEASKQLTHQIFDAGSTLSMVLKYIDVHSLDGVRVIVGSVRTPQQIDQAFARGAHIVTINPELLELWMYTERGVETADEFNKAFDDVRNEVKLI